MEDIEDDPTMPELIDAPNIYTESGMMKEYAKFINACSNGNLDIVENIINGLDSMELISVWIYSGFTKAINNNQVEMAKVLDAIELYVKIIKICIYSPNITDCNDDLLIYFIDKFIKNHSIHFVSIHLRDDELFKYLCMYGRLKTVNWLNATLYPCSNIFNEIELDSIVFCENWFHNNTIEMLDWMITYCDEFKLFLSGRDSHIQTLNFFVNEFMYCCENLHPGMILKAQWLIRNKYEAFNIRGDDDRFFKMVCESDNVKMAVFLVSLCDDYELILNEDETTIINWEIHNYVSKMLKLENYPAIVSYFNITTNNNRNEIKNYGEGGEEELECAICLCEIDHLIKPGCNHNACAKCLFRWINDRNTMTCPTCRTLMEFSTCVYYPPA